MPVRPNRPVKTPNIATSALSLLFLAGCATQQTRISDDVASKINRVAVISMTAKTFTRQYTGLTVFGNEKEEIDISDWKIDAQYEEQIREQLKKGYGFDAVAAPYSEADFSHVNDLNGPWDAPAFWGPNWDAIEAATKSYCASNSLDAVFVLARTKTSDIIAGTNQFFGGAGIYSRGPMGKTAVLHLISKMALLDCATAKPLAVRHLANKQDGLRGTITRSSPLSPVNFEESRHPMQQWSTEHKQRIRSALLDLPRSAMVETLRSMLPTQTIGREAH